MIDDGLEMKPKSGGGGGVTTYSGMAAVGADAAAAHEPNHDSAAVICEPTSDDDGGAETLALFNSGSDSGIGSGCMLEMAHKAQWLEYCKMNRVAAGRM